MILVRSNICVNICDALFTTIDFCFHNGIITADDLGKNYGTDRYKNDLEGYIGLSKSHKVKDMTKVQKILDILDSVYSVAYGEKIDWEKNRPSFERYSRDPNDEGIYTEKTEFELIIRQDNIKKALKDCIPKDDGKQSIKDVYELAKFLQYNPTARLILRTADDLNRKGWLITQSQLVPVSRTAERKNESFRVFLAIKLTILALLCTDRKSKTITINEETIARCMCIHIESCKTNPCDVINALGKDLIILTSKPISGNGWQLEKEDDSSKLYVNKDKHKIAIIECKTNDFGNNRINGQFLSTKMRGIKDAYTYGFNEKDYRYIITETNMKDIKRLESVGCGYTVSRVSNSFDPDDYLIDKTFKKNNEEMMPIARGLLEGYLHKMNEAYLDGNWILYRSFFEQLLSTKYENTEGRMMLTGGKRNEWGFWVDDSLTITLFRIYAQEKCPIITPTALILTNEWNIHLPRGSVFVMNNHIALVAKFTLNGNELTEIKVFVDTIREQENNFNVVEGIEKILKENKKCYKRMAKKMGKKEEDVQRELYDYSRKKDIPFVNEAFINEFYNNLESSSENQIR